MARFKRRAGVFAILTSLDSFEEAMAVFSLRRDIFDEFSMFMDEMDGRWMIKTSKVDEGHIFIRFLATMIRSGMRNRLRDSGMSLDTALNVASTYGVVFAGGRVYQSKRDMRTTSILAMFDVDDLNLNDASDRD